MKKFLSLFLVAVLLLSLTVPVFAGAGASRSEAIVQTNGLFASRVPAGATLWFTYSNPELVANGEFAQKLNVSCDAQYSCTVTYGDAGSEKTIDSDVDGFVNIVLNDKDRSGNYTFAITNHATRPVKFTVVFESLPTYVMTGVDVYLGDNSVTYDSSAPTALYSFSSGDVVITDVDGNVISTVEGGGAGKYKFSVLNTAGEVIRGALLGNWGTIGYPLDLTGDLKTNTFTWNTEEEDASFLLGVSNVFEDFIIRVERTGDYVSDQQEIVFEDYTNIHTPGAVQIPAGEKVEFNINETYTLVADTNGVYHLDTVNGPVVYVDMINDVIDLYGAYHNAYGAGVLRGIYTNDLGVTCGYEFFGAMEAYANVLDTEGCYPMTVDFETFIKTFGAAQGWFTEGYTPYPEIENGGNPESYWLIEAFYVVPGSDDDNSDTNAPDTDVTDTDTPDTNAPDTNVPGTDVPDTNVPGTDAPDTNVPDTNVPSTDAPDTNVPGTDAPDTNVPGTDVPDTNVPGTDTTDTNVPDTNASDTNAPDTNVPGTDTTDTNVPGTDSSETNVPGTNSPEIDAPGENTPETEAPDTNAPDTNSPETTIPGESAPETDTPDTNAPESNHPETDAPETEIVVEDVVIDPVVGEESGDVKLPIVSNGDIGNSTKLTYTFEFNTNMFEFKEIVGLDKGDYTVEVNEKGVVVIITNVGKVAAANAGSKIFELVLSPKVDNAKTEDLNLKVEYKNEKTVEDTNSNNGLGVAPDKSPATGDNAVFVAVVAFVAVLSCVVIRRRREIF